MANGLAFFSPGSSTGARSERSALVVPPSTSSGPRMLLRMCGCFGKLRRLARSAGTLKLASATTGTLTGIHQLVVSKLTRADHWVNVWLPLASPIAPTAVTCSVCTWLPLSAWIFQTVGEPLILKIWPSRKPSSSQLELSLRVIVLWPVVKRLRQRSRPASAT